MKDKEIKVSGGLRTEAESLEAELNKKWFEKNPSSWFRPQFESAEYDPWKESLPDSKKAGRHEKPTYENMKNNWVNKRSKSE